MSAKTRYFVIASLLVVAVGLCIGLVAYYVGLPTRAYSPAGGPEELQLIPSTASVVAYADVHEIMISEVRQKIRAFMPNGAQGRQDFQARTGINVETDIDHIVAGFVPSPDGQAGPTAALVLARGRFDDVKIGALMKEHGAEVLEYKGRQLLVAPAEPPRNESLAVAFISPGLVAIGGAPLVRTAIDLRDGGASVATNDEVMNSIRALDPASAWAVGRVDALAGRGRLPMGLAAQLPAMTWFSASARVDSSVRGEVRAQARDEDAANNLRDVLRGVVAMVKLQAASQPALKSVVDSLEIRGSGQTVSFSFDVPSEAIDAVGASLHK